MTTCPTCAHAVAPARGLELRAGALFSGSGCVRLGPVATAIVRALMAGPLPTPALAERIYGCSGDAPDYPDKAINTAVGKLRRGLRPIGWTITNGCGRGRGGAVYRLVELAPERIVA